MATLVVLLCRGLLGVVSSLAVIAVGPVLVGMTSTVVMSDSMAPGIRAGDVVVVRSVPAATLQVGQVLLVDDPDFPGRLRLHRMVGRDDGALVLKGDSNGQDDSARVAPRTVHGVGFLRVPWIGLPLLWLRTGHAELTLVALAVVAAAAGAVALLDPGSGGPARRGAVLLRRCTAAPARAWRRVRRSRAGGIALTGLVVTGAVAAATAQAPSSWAAFVGTTSSPGNSLATGTWACPAVASPSPDVLYSFMAASGTDEPNRIDASKAAGSYGATLSSDSLRVPGTCAANASPYLRFSGAASENLIGTTRLAATDPGTVSLWFSPAAATGLIQSVGAAAGATDRSAVRAADRQLYFTTDGRLAFAMRDGTSSITSCALPGTVSLNTWHFAVVTYVSQTMTFRLYLDGSGTSCSATLGTAPSGTPFLRIGNDTMIASDAATSPYSGGIDEVAAWGGPLTAAQVDSVRASGH